MALMASVADAYARQIRPRLVDSGDCLVYTGRLCGDGYGTITFGGSRAKGGRTIRCHRIAYEAHFGRIPDGAVVMHTCDNRACCNPAHLRLGTQAENIADMNAKGRHAPRTSDLLTPEKLAAIKDALAAGIPGREVARRFGISKSYAFLLKRHTPHLRQPAPSADNRPATSP